METKKEKKMKVPHVLAIFVIIMLVISALTPRASMTVRWTRPRAAR